MTDKKMIVVDLDGTLLNIKGECSRKTKRYLKRLKDLGYIIVIATGRVLRSAIEITDGATFANYIIANAGALVYDMDNSKIIMKKNISLDETRRICSYYNEDIEYINICDLFYHHRYRNDFYYNDMFDKKINNIDIFLEKCEDVLHITVKLKDNSLVNKYYDIINNNNLEVLVMQDSFNNNKWLEIFKSGVSKYNAIKVVMDIEGIINDNVIAFGDGLNDVEMIKFVGIGVAMGNALDEVKSVSDYITISHNNDGVVYFLRDFIKENN